MSLKNQYKLPEIWVLASLLLMLSACSTNPVRPPIPIPETPRIDLEIPKRVKPEAAMGKCQEFPYLPNLSLLTEDIQAKTIVSAWNEAAEVYRLCKEDKTILIKWIREDS